MKLSDRTLSILKNFSTINQSIYIPQGNVLATVATGNNIMGRAVVDDQFPADLPIYDLSRFLGAVSLLPEPEFDFSEEGLIKISSGSTVIRYACADEALIHKARTELPPLPEPVFETDSLTSDQLGHILKAANVMKMEDLTFKGDGERMQVIAHNVENPSADQYAVTLENTDVKCQVNLKINNIKVHTGTDYVLKLYKLKSGTVIVGMTSVGDGELMYLISSETSSTLEE